MCWLFYRGIVKSGERRSTVVWPWIAGTWLSALLVLAWILLQGVRTSPFGVVMTTGGRVAAVSLLVVAVLPAFVESLDVRVPRWVAGATGVVTFAITLLLWLLVHTGRESLAWATYGGLQVLKGSSVFADLTWDLNWFDCNYCDEWDPHYGPGLRWINEVMGGSIHASWVPLLGMVFASLLALSLSWIMMRSSGRGQLVLLIVAVSPAWLLLLDRANLDAVAVLAVVFGAFVVGRRRGLGPWLLFAIAILVAGSLKYYPLVAGVAILPVLKVKRGWLILVGFAVAASALMVMSW